jgi:peroxin-6
MLYLGVNETHEAQLKIIEALTRKFKLHPDLNLKDIADLCTFNYTGADFYALCSDAILNAMSRTAQRIEDQLGVEITFICFLHESQMKLQRE